MRAVSSIVVATCFAALGNAGCASETSTIDAPDIVAAAAEAADAGAMDRTVTPDGPTESATVDATSPESPRDRARREAWEAAIRGVALRGERLVVTEPLPGGSDLAAAARAERRTQELGNHRTAAVAAAVRVVRAAPEFARGWIELGESLGHRGRGELAAGAYTRALELASDPIDVFDARRQRATGHAAAADWTAAIADMEAALVVAPADGDAHARLAVWNWYAGDVEAASRHLDRATDLGGRVPGSLSGLIRDAAAGG